MKKIIITLSALALNITAFAQLKYEISGTMKSVPAYKVTVTLYYSAPSGKFVADTCVVKNGKFSFSGEVSRVLPAFLAMTDGDDNLTKALNRGATDSKAVKLVQNGVFLETGKITALLDHEKQVDAVITGTPNNDALQGFRPVMNKYKALEASIYARNKAAADNPAQTDILLREYKTMVANRAVEIGGLIKKYPESLAAMDFLGRWIDPAENFAGAKKYFEYLSAERQNSPAGQRYLSRIKQAGTVEIGAMAPDFSMPDVDGKMRKLSDLKGKYVLLDFWASWCVPCRKETPNLISTYKQFKDSKFEIFAVSLDGGKPDARDKWLEAIKEDKMTWPQVSDLSGFSSNVASVYAIQAIPMNFLIDPNGKIIYKNLRGQELRDVLSKLLSQQSK